MKKRTLIILVAILVLLYLVGTTMTLARGDGNNNSAKNPPSWMKGVGSLLDGPGSILERDLTVKDVQTSSSTCRQQFANRQITSTCTFTIRSQGRFRRTRVLALSRQQGNPSIMVKVKGESETETLGRGVEKFPIHRDGGVITVNCSGSCTVRVQ